MARNHSERRRRQNHPPVTHGSLFSGIGGFDLAAEWMGWENLFNCEWEEFPRKVLKHHFPNVKQYGDIKEFNAATYSGRIDILTGGFPCQPYSTAGKRKGKQDERHLWPEMLRVVRECSPRWIVGENVRGLVNWNGGLVFEEVCADLETCGYSVQPFILPACAVNAPHRRDRVWFVAHTNERNDGRTAGKNAGESGEERIQERNSIRKPAEPNPIRQLSPDTEHNGHPSPQGGRSNGTNSERSEKGQEVTKQFKGVRKPEKLGSVYAPDTCGSVRRNSKKGGNRRNEQGEKREKGAGLKFTGFSGEPNAPDTNNAGERQNNRQGKPGQFDQTRTLADWKNFPTQSPLCGGDDGLPKELDGITFSKWRRESIKGYGNAIVPQVALRIFEAIQEYEKRT